MHPESLAVIRRAKRTGYRALIVAGGDRHSIVQELAAKSGGDCAIIGDKTVRTGLCRLERSPAKYQDILGSGYGAVIISLESMVRPSIICAAGEAVRGGGFLALAGPPWEEWHLGVREGPGYYKRYLARMIPRARLHAWTSRDRLISSKYDVAPRQDQPKGPYRSRAGVPRKIMSIAATQSQAEALDRLLTFLRGRERAFLLLGDRGRGKSYTVGLALAVGVWFKLVGNAAVVGPSPRSVAEVFRGLVRGLESLGVGFRVRRSGGDVVRVSGSWFRVAYEPPGKRVQEPVVVVDEAAAIGPARVRRLSWRASKTIISTTIHGYEGSGRSLAILMKNWLPRPFTEYWLLEPIRYPPGDPLEEWLYDTFFLRFDPPSIASPRQVRYRLVDREDLVRDTGLLRSVMILLSRAHYRTSPDSLLLILEAEHHHVHVLEGEDGVIAVAETVDEHAGGPGAALASERLRLVAPWSGERVVRVSRIAVHPELQKRGYGSLLLRHVEEWAGSSGYSIVATLFSRHEVVGFWLRNGYTPFYASPRYNKTTGEKNLGFLKAVDPSAMSVVQAAGCNFLRRLLLLSPSIYRDIDAESVSKLLSIRGGCGFLAFPLSDNEKSRLAMFLDGEIGYEQAMDAAVLALFNIVLRHGMPRHMTTESLLLLTARLIQGKPLDDAARIAGVSIEDAARIIEDSLREVLSRYGELS